MNLNELKKNYAILEKKYKLPSFSELNENFEIEKIKEESETLIRSIRKVMMEKMINSLGFVEVLLNPMNAPRMYLSYIKSIGVEERKDIEKIYSSLSDIAVSSFELEIDYSEEGEAKMVNRIFKEWESLKQEFRKILTNMQKPSSASAVKEKSYFG